jgi:hypothetical protein
VIRKSARRTPLLTALLLAAGTTPASACGFEDPTGAEAQRGALNWAFPDSLHVTSAVWRAQLEGSIARDDRPAAVRALSGFGKAVADLTTFRNWLDAARAQQPSPGLSILLIGPMLWSRIVPTADGLSIVTHLAGAERTDVVIVTDAPVVAAIVSGRISAQTALQKGLLRLYGPVDGQVSAADWLGRLQSPMVASSQMPTNE